MKGVDCAISRLSGNDLMLEGADSTLLDQYKMTKLFFYCCIQDKQKENGR